MKIYDYDYMEKQAKFLSYLPVYYIVIIESGQGKERNLAFLIAFGNRRVGTSPTRKLMEES